MTLSAHWSGILPDPASFRAYPDWVQQEIMAWQRDAQLGASQRQHEVLMAESVRQDKLVDAEIRSAVTGQWMAGTIGAAMVLGALLLALRGNNVGAGLLVGMPLVAFLIALLRRED